mgnify:CR=1 FL=1
MPQETKTHGRDLAEASAKAGHEHPKLEGNVFRPRNFAELVDAIDTAFDYRGDVTVELKDGRTIEGFLFNRERDVATPIVKLFPKNQPGELAIAYHDIASVEFTGEDKAFGKSWETWIKKNEEQRKADDAKVRAVAAALGHL